MRSLGEAGMVEAESETILIDQQIDYAEFPQAVEDCLPKDLPWTIPAVSTGRWMPPCVAKIRTHRHFEWPWQV